MRKPFTWSCHISMFCWKGLQDTVRPFRDGTTKARDVLEYDVWGHLTGEELWYVVVLAEGQGNIYCGVHNG